MKNRLHEGYYWVESDYDSTFINAMKSLGGKWSSTTSEWKVKENHKAQLFPILEDLFGHNGIEEYEKCTIVFDPKPNSQRDVIKIGCSIFGKRYNRDSAVNLHENCCIISGGFHESGGSHKNPQIDSREGTLIKCIDFPVGLVDKISGDYTVLDSVEQEIKEEMKITTEELIKELERRGYEVIKKTNIPEELIDA